MKKKAVCPVDGCIIGYVDIKKDKKCYVVSCYSCQEPEHEIYADDLKDMTLDDYKNMYGYLEQCIHDKSAHVLRDMRNTKDMNKLSMLDAQIDILQQILEENDIPSRLEEVKQKLQN